MFYQGEYAVVQTNSLRKEWIECSLLKVVFVCVQIWIKYLLIMVLMSCSQSSKVFSGPGFPVKVWLLLSNFQQYGSQSHFNKSFNEFVFLCSKPSEIICSLTNYIHRRQCTWKLIVIFDHQRLFAAISVSCAKPPHPPSPVCKWIHTLTLRLLGKFSCR